MARCAASAAGRDNAAAPRDRRARTRYTNASHHCCWLQVGTSGGVPSARARACSRTAARMDRLGVAPWAACMTGAAAAGNNRCHTSSIWAARSTAGVAGVFPRRADCGVRRATSGSQHKRRPHPQPAALCWLGARRDWGWRGPAISPSPRPPRQSGRRVPRRDAPFACGEPGAALSHSCPGELGLARRLPKRRVLLQCGRHFTSASPQVSAALTRHFSRIAELGRNVSRRASAARKISSVDSRRARTCAHAASSRSAPASRVAASTVLCHPPQRPLSLTPAMVVKHQCECYLRPGAFPACYRAPAR